MKALPTGLSTRSKSLPTRSIFCIRAALDVPLAKLFDYSVPAGMEARVGDRVVVPFGARQRLGVVLEGGVTSELPAARVKPIVALRDDAPRLPADWIELMRFLSSYYQRPLGETVISALPPRLRSVKPLPRKALQSASAPWSARFVPNHSLTAAQTRALDRMASALDSFSAFLLHGVTGSGKTEVYLHLISRVLARGGQALVLVPEISLTPQLEAIFRRAFPETRLALLHSGLEDVARTGSWLDAARGGAGIVLGTRLAVLAPLPKLALVVVDEEHDTSFKQQEGLRYSARDVAVYRAKLAGCPAILGTATPSLETWHNWQSGRYERWRCGAEDSRAAGELRPVYRDVSRRVAQAFLLLERGVVLLVDHDQRQFRQRREHGEACAEHDAGAAARGIQPGAGARHILQAAVQQRQPRFGEGLAKDRLELGCQADLRDQDQRLAASRKNSGNEVQVHLGLSAAGHAVQQERAEAVERARHSIEGARLSRVERMVRHEACRPRRRSGLKRFARQRLHRAQARRQRADHGLAERALVIAGEKAHQLDPVRGQARCIVA